MNCIFMLNIGFHLYIGCESENLVVWCVQEWEDQAKLINNLETIRSSHSLWGIASIEDSIFLLSEWQEWIMNISESPEWLYEQHGIVHSLFTSSIMKSLWVRLLSVWFLQPSKYEHASLASACIIAFQHTRFAWHTSYLQTNFGLSLHRLIQRVSFKEAELSPHV